MKLTCNLSKYPLQSQSAEWQVNNVHMQPKQVPTPKPCAVASLPTFADKPEPICCNTDRKTQDQEKHQDISHSILLWTLQAEEHTNVLFTSSNVMQKLNTRFLKVYRIHNSFFSEFLKGARKIPNSMKQIYGIQSLQTVRCTYSIAIWSNHKDVCRKMSISPAKHDAKKNHPPLVCIFGSKIETGDECQARPRPNCKPCT